MGITDETIAEVSRKLRADIERAERRKQSTRLRRQFESEGYSVALCEHLENDTDGAHVERCITAGPKTAFILCQYCSGLLVETILAELRGRR